MSKVATAESIGTRRDVPVINPNALTWDYQGIETGKATIRLPLGFEFTDVNEATGAFVKIQASPRTALVWRDEVRMISYDETWEALAYVNYSDHERVIFSKIQRIDYQRRADIPETENHVVRYARTGDMGVGYCVIAKADQRLVAGPFKGAGGKVSASAAVPRPAQVA